jgi:hypothetical protein
MNDTKDDLDELLKRLEAGWLPNEPAAIEPAEKRPAPAEARQTRSWEPGAVCWHCHGYGECGCLSCGTARWLEQAKGMCITCKGTGRIPCRLQ